MKLADLSPYDEFFTHISDDGTNTQTTYAVSAITKNLEQLGWPVVLIPVEQHHAMYCLQHRGVEERRLKRLREVDLDRPIIFVHQLDGTHLLIDGTHRYVKAFMTGRTEIRAHIVHVSLVAPFIVEDAPKMTEDQLFNTESGL